MIAINLNRVKDIQEKFEGEIKKQYENALKKLQNIKPDSTDDCNYLNQSIELFKNNINILTKTPNEIDTIIENFPSVPLIVRKNEKREEKIVKSKIKDEILTALDYKGLRKEFYPKYFKEIGIKVCVYCNANLAISVDRIDNEGKDDVRAKFQVDHYYPKSEYPIFSISLFNLYPACASCNLAKSDNKVHFKLYTDIPNDLIESNFTFKLTDYDQAKYLLNGRINPPKFLFYEEPKEINEGYSKFGSTFDINGIYDTQIDLIEDLIDKSLVYDFAFQKSLVENFPKLFLTKEHFERFILGNYSRAQDIHKRPMSKFMQDIAKDLGII